MTQNQIWLVQSIALGAQVLNAGIATATHNAVVALIVAATAATLSAYAQHMGNQNTPNTLATPAVKDEQKQGQ